jgi:hypothetical protein
MSTPASGELHCLVIRSLIHCRRTDYCGVAKRFLDYIRKAHLPSSNLGRITGQPASRFRAPAQLLQANTGIVTSDRRITKLQILTYTLFIFPFIDYTKRYEIQNNVKNSKNSLNQTTFCIKHLLLSSYTATLKVTCHFLYWSIF